MSASDVITDAVEDLTHAEREAREKGERMVTVKTYHLLALLAACGSLLIANGMLYRQNEGLRAEAGDEG